MTKEQLQNALNEATARIDEQKTKIGDLETENAKLVAALKEAGAPADKGRIGILLGAISKSCADHCPHHMNESACQNCGIYKMLFKAGFKLAMPQKTEEKE